MRIGNLIGDGGAGCIGVGGEGREAAAVVVGLAKAQDVADLKRTLRALEDEIGRLRSELRGRSEG